MEMNQQPPKSLAQLEAILRNLDNERCLQSQVTLSVPDETGSKRVWHFSATSMDQSQFAKLLEVLHESMESLRKQLIINQTAEQLAGGDAILQARLTQGIDTLLSQALMEREYGIDDESITDR